MANPLYAVDRRVGHSDPFFTKGLIIHNARSWEEGMSKYLLYLCLVMEEISEGEEETWKQNNNSSDTYLGKQ
jgi:hypothetical protein